MVFSSLTFLFYFLPIVLIIYYIVPNKVKNLVLFISSLIFYFIGEPKYVILMIVSILSTYIHGILIEKYEKHKKKFLISSIVISLSFLVFFKYTDFIIENVNVIFNGSFDLLNLALPIGISFYTFKMISYIVDVYTKKVKVQKNFLKLATYVSLFPQLMAGPIVRYSTIEKELDERKYSFAIFSNGVRRFIIGLCKKILIADVLSDVVNSFSTVTEKTVLFYWIYAISITLQIYFDFSGYSDIAIGCSKCLGFTMPTNFNLPYLSRNITEFWKRWHITLSDWLMNYLYIPLGGNRKGHIRTFINLFLTMVIGGLWHGASWNFVLWGALHGIALCIHKQFMKTKKISKDFVPSLPKFIMGVLGTYLFTNFCWIFFRITDIRVIGQLLYRIGTCSTGVAFYSWWTIIGIGFMIISTSITIMKNFWNQKREKCNYTSIQAFYVKKDLSKFRNLVLFFFLIGLVIGLAYADSNPFIYAAF